MNKISAVCIFIGVLIILIRGPLLLAPEAVIRFSLKLTNTNLRIRILGFFTLCVSLPIIYLVWDSDLLISKVILVWWGLGAAASIILLMILPNTYRRMLIFFSELDLSVPRTVGLIGLLIGGAFIYAGLFEV